MLLKVNSLLLVVAIQPPLNTILYVFHTLYSSLKNKRNRRKRKYIERKGIL